MRGAAAATLAGLLLLSGCFRKPPPAPPPLVAAPHYFLGTPYEMGGRWYYPAESYGYDRTGIAAISVPHPDRALTADGELPDPSLATGAMRTIQLPAIVRVTNLDNGRQIELRVNDRGPEDPARLIGLSPRAALLLGMTGPARVRVQVDETLSHRLVDQLGGGPKLSIAIAPAATVSAEALPPPGSHAAAGPAQTIGVHQSVAQGPRVPDRLPEQIFSVGADPGQIFIDAGSFGRVDYANSLAARLAGLGATVLRSRDGRQMIYAVRAGPFRTIRDADAALTTALRDGAVDAQMTIDP